MLTLAGEIVNLTESDSKIELRPLPGDDPKQREPLIQKAELLIGWKPQVDRRAGLIKTIGYFRTLLK
jgi:nucleoside-diphosphate-sugar epimerase